jgi:hypothetical protein
MNDLDAIKAHLHALAVAQDDEEFFDRAATVGDDAKQLIAEVERLRALVTDLVDEVLPGGAS